jgi:aryl-alcohol dehydrogenase-like predicted oxidoreductase
MSHASADSSHVRGGLSARAEGSHVVERRQLGSRGPAITRVGFGAWAIGGAWKHGWGPTDDDVSVEAIRHAIEAGVNWIDTAAVYGLGHSEEVVGKAIEPFAVGEEVYVFTKCGRNWYGKGSEIENDLRPDSIRFECEQSMRRLGLDRIDLYQFHRPDDLTGTALEESWGAMAQLAEEGKVRWIGLSNFDVALVERCHAIRHVDAVQPPLSLIDQRARHDLIPWCREHGTGVIVYSPMATGLLTGAFGRARFESLPHDDWRRRMPNFQEPRFSQILALVERLRPIVKRRGTTFAVLAVAWTLTVPGVTGAIVGARHREHVDGWLPATDFELDGAELAEINRLIAESEVQ